MSCHRGVKRLGVHYRGEEGVGTPFSLRDGNYRKGTGHQNRTSRPLKPGRVHRRGKEKNRKLVKLTLRHFSKARMGGRLSCRERSRLV